MQDECAKHPSFFMQQQVLYHPEFSRPFYVNAKPAGAACNLACSYCYYLEKKHTLSASKEMPEAMHDTVLEQFVKQYIHAQTLPAVLFTWHGGEPLLRGLDFYKKALHFQKIYRAGRAIDNCIQTNGTLLTDDWCRFLKEHHFLVGISIDGPETLHNSYRLTRNGNGSFREVMSGIGLLLKHGVEFNTLSVVNNINAQQPLEVYRFLKSIGSRFMQFTPVVERIITEGKQQGQLAHSGTTAAAKITEYSVNPLDYGRFLCAIFDEWVRRDVGKYYVTQFDATLACRAGQAPNNCLYVPECGHALAVEANGDVYACDHFVFPGYRTGNLLKTPLATLAYSQKQLNFGKLKSDLSDECFQCEYLQTCYGECPKNRIVKAADGKPHNYLCEGLKRYFAHIAPYMDYMLNELRNGRPPANVMNLFTPQH